MIESVSSYIDHTNLSQTASKSDIENWFTEKFLTSIVVFLSTMALGTTLVYIIFISLKITGISKLLKSIKDPRIN